ncbi:hypothetical protein [Cohnella sp. REN36]|uniref:hypothetical protein n=1 Tax=Cohnella sp. REN36 TaxID=2887347 RepID=UPI001D140541|nr:hypothetical protein [Cohnella sp. REN36]MCC3373293.1 hypothetical protein [Cohnella sp. REN36]
MLFAPVEINVLTFKINALDHSSVMNMGTTYHADQIVSYKRNQGIGEQHGDRSPIQGTVSWVADSDLIDSLTHKVSIL